MLFAFFGLWETTVAVAAGAASIPIIIHLLNRKRFRIVVWAAMKFLLAAQKQNTRRMRLEQLILLAVRVLLVLLIVLAMASVMPWAENVWAYFWPEGGGFVTVRSGRTYKIIVLDASLSMNQMVQGKTAFERAREMAVKMVQDSGGGDGFSVLLMKEVPTWIVAEAAQDGHKVAAEIKALEPTHGNTSAASALNMVAAKLAEASARYTSREIYFFTDMQQTTWVSSQAPISAKGEKGEKSPLEEIQRRARTIFVDVVGKEAPGNLAVTDLRLGESPVTTKALVSISGVVQNFGKEMRRRVRVALLIGQAGEGANEPMVLRVQNQDYYDISAGGHETINFVHRFNAPGTYAVQMRLIGNDQEAGGTRAVDDLDADNARTIIVTVRDQVPIMLVNGKPAVERFDQATEYLRLALNPFPANEPVERAPLRPKVVSATQFADTNEGDLTNYDCVFLADMVPLGTGEVRRLEHHLRRGGGIVVSFGDQVARNLEENFEKFNGLMAKAGRPILPARLAKKIVAPADHHFRLQANEDAFLEPPLKAFADSDDRTSLQTPRFRQYLQVKPLPDSKARTVMIFSPEVQPLSKVALNKTLPVSDPAIMEWNPPLPRDKDAKPGRLPMPARYRGKVILLTSTINMDWNNWPGSPSFGAMMQELARLAVAGRLKERALLCGQPIEEYLPTGDEVDVQAFAPHPEDVHRRGATEKSILEGKYKVRDFAAQAQKKRSEAGGELNVFRWDKTDLSGIYLLSWGRNGEEIPVAVNFPAATSDQRGSESDLTRVDKNKLAEAYKGWEFQVVTDPSRVLTPQGQTENETQVAAPMGPGIAHGLLLAVLVLLLLEVVLAWVFGHYSAVAGTPEVARGTVGPIVVASIAGVLFIGGAVILINAAQTGDFLGFAPDWFRGWIESWMDVPPPASGEATHWDPEFKTVFLRDAGSDPWLVAGVALLAILLVYFIYRAEAPNTSGPYKFLLGGLRLFLILLTLAVLLPQLQVRFDRQGWPDVVLLIDDSRSMGEPDYYQDEQQQEAVKQFTEQIRQREKERLPVRIKALQEELDQKREKSSPQEIAALTQKIQALENQRLQVNSPSWRPTRLQLVQALLAQKDPDWLETLVGHRRMKVHLFHLDANGRAINLTEGDITLQDSQKIERAKKAVADLEAEGKESRLGTALKQVLDSYRGSSLAAVVMFTDGVTTRDETIGQASEYAAQKGVPLFFVGLGDDHPIRDLKLHDLQVPDVVYVGDRVNFQALLTGQGYKDLTVPITLKVKEKDGKEKEVAPRKMTTVDATGKSVKVQMQHQPTKPGRVLYIMEVVLPKVDRPDKAVPPNHTRLERTIDVIESKLIKVLYVETTPRYEFRFIKSLLERERPDDKKNRSVDLKVVLLDADADFPLQDKSALADFPATKEALDAYDVIILGDCDPRHPRLGEKRLRNLADFVRGEDAKGKRGAKTGGGLLMIGGPNFSPHAFAGTPLAAVMPIEPDAKAPPEPEERKDSYRLQITSVGRQHPIFRLSPDDAVNVAIWQKLAPMYWFADGYRIKPLAEVLAVHPGRKAQGRDLVHGGLHPLAVQQFVGSGRCMFFGFEETWRWRFREDEAYFNKFWIETVRYLSRSRVTRTTLRLDRQTPYRLGEPIKVIVQFPDNTPLPGKGAKDIKTDVKVIVEFTPASVGDEKVDPEIQTMKLSKMENSWSNFEGYLNKTREGKYHFWLSFPDVSKEDPGGQKPSADAKVELPPGELDRLRMNQEEMTQAADATRGRFYTLVNANDLLHELPAGVRPSLSTSRPPWLLWNHVLCFALILFLLTAEWLLRKRKHLL
jgi:hypothetical protein